MNFLIRKRYNRKGIGEDIDNHVKKCKLCETSGYQLINTKNKAIETQRPNQIWEVDLIGKIFDCEKKINLSS